MFVVQVPGDVVVVRLLCRLQAKVYAKHDGDGACTCCIFNGDSLLGWVLVLSGHQCDEGFNSMEHILKLTSVKGELALGSMHRDTCQCWKEREQVMCRCA
ncbi:hypothetical protein Tco_0663448 [Tanacetum coccineum]